MENGCGRKGDWLYCNYQQTGEGKYMLKRFTVKNYKNFKDSICIDFEKIAGYQYNKDCLTDDLLSKILIYGRNATGKTNLGRALLDIRFMLIQNFFYMNHREGVFLNADSTEDFATFSYAFQFDRKELIYQYTRFSDFELRDEKLMIDGALIFQCDFAKKSYDFCNLEGIYAETANVERYLEALQKRREEDEMAEFILPFLRWLINNIALENDSILLRLTDYVRKMQMITANNGNAMTFYLSRVQDSFFKSLEKEKNLDDLEEFLNQMGVACKLKLKEMPDGQKELYFAHKKLVPFFENISSGTLALVNLYRQIVSKGWDISLLYLDEFDAFYHYEMAKNVVQYFKKRYPRCQLIMTSHNTNLMTNRQMRPDCLFILSTSGKLTSLCDATSRELREGHNLEKMYISGEFASYE